MRCGRIQPRVFQRLDVRASRLDLVQQSEQIADRSRQSIQSHHHEGVARFQRVQRLLQRVPPIRAFGRYLLGKELLAARRLELIDLAVEILSVARNSRIADVGHLTFPLWNADIRNTNMPALCGARMYSVRSNVAECQGERLARPRELCETARLPQVYCPRRKSTRTSRTMCSTAR